jgi:hypothetical protein
MKEKNIIKMNRQNRFNGFLSRKKIQEIMLVFLFSFLLFSETSGQTTTSFSISNSTLVSTSEKMPFWIWANTNGKIDKNNSFLNLLEVNAEGVHFFNKKNLILKAGATLNYGIGNNNRYFQANQIFTRLNLNNWELSIGMYHNDLFFKGLSTTNGNIAKSRNARPLPRISLRVSEYKPIPFLNNILFFKGEYDEGFLTDKRYVNNAHLHHKSLYLRLNLFQNLSIEGGAEHFVMWGGTSRNAKTGKLPSNVSAYFRYISGSQGDSKFPIMDQMNVAGNQYGTYQILITQKFKQFEASLNISHPFEDFSGVNLQNWPDNTIGILIKLNNTNKFITHFIYEYTNTRQQGIKNALRYWSEKEQKWKSHEYDNYFNHSIYKSGVTYYNKTSGSPLFMPIKQEDNICRGIESTRFFAHHIGFKGNISKTIRWKSLITYIQQLGTWQKPYSPPHSQTSILLNFLYSENIIPFKIDLTIAGDIGTNYKNYLGLQLKIQYEF